MPELLESRRAAMGAVRVIAASADAPVLTEHVGKGVRALFPRSGRLDEDRAALMKLVDAGVAPRLMSLGDAEGLREQAIFGDCALWLGAPILKRAPRAMADGRWIDIGLAPSAAEIASLCFETAWMLAEPTPVPSPAARAADFSAELKAVLERWAASARLFSNSSRP